MRRVDPERSWITLHPDWYRTERTRIRRRFPGFRVSDAELARGVLAYAGEIVVDLGRERRVHPVVLIYDTETPYHAPHLFPIQALPAGSDWVLEDVLEPENIFRMPRGFRRHQMFDGGLCLIEADSFRREQQITGVAMLNRARDAFRALALNRPFPFADTQEAELEEHLPRSGDILLAESFFDPTLTGGGAFYAVKSFDTYQTLPTFVPQEAELIRTLYLGAHLTAREGTGSRLETDWRNEVSEAIRHAFPFLGYWQFSLEQHATDTQQRFDGHSIEGAWFDLAEEPEPFHTVHELEDVIRAGTDIADPLSEILRYAGGMKQRGEGVHVGLRFPGRDGTPDWLFLQLLLREAVTDALLEEDGPGVRRDVLRGALVVALRRHALLRPSLEVRNRGRVPGGLAEKTVLMLGTGSLGGEIADTLAKAGVGTLVLVDPDLVRPGNVVRHVAGLAATGLAKTDAVRHVLHQHNPFVSVESVPKSATRSLGDLEALLDRADLVVSTIADENVEAVVNEAAVRLGRTVIYGRALRAGTAARVFRVRPARDACKQCLAQYRVEAEHYRTAGSTGGDVVRVGDVNGGAPPLDWLDLPEVPGEIISRECGNPVLAGSAADLRFAANLTARAALDELGDGVEWNNLLWSREPLPDVHADLARPYATLLRTISPHPRCSTCGRPRTVAITLSPEARESIVRLTQGKPDRETGGVLIGYVDDVGVAVVVEATDAGPNATETPTRYEHDVSYVNACLREAAERLGERGRYIGEWHSHLERDPRPSARDVESLSDIAAAPNYLTDEPVMVIAGLDPATGQVTTLHGSCFPVGLRMHEILIRDVNTPASTSGAPPATEALSL